MDSYTKYYKLYKSGRKRPWVKFNCSECGEPVDMMWKPNRYDGRCPACKGGRQPGYTLSDFISEARRVHGDKYTYDNAVYINAHTKLAITCPKHGDFRQKPCNHLTLANGCVECGRESRVITKASDSINAIFYVIHLTDHNLFKVGVTVYSVQRRYCGEHVNYTVLHESTGLSAKQAYKLEAEAKQISSAFKYRGPTPFRNTGITEVFTKNPLVMGLQV